MTQQSLGFGLYAPAGYVIDAAALTRAMELLSTLGHSVVVDPTCHTRWQRFSATDEERLRAVMRMAGDPAVDVVMAMRGGFGWSRLLDHLDFPTIAASDKRWMGHSDFTAFSLAALAHAGMVSYAGPMGAYDFGAMQPSSFTIEHCMRMLEHGEDIVECALNGPDFAAEGTLWGGNLAMVAHLVGSPHWPQISGGILFLEDIGEQPYRVERMLHQLHFAGVLRAQRAVVLGGFNGYAPGTNDNGYDLDTVIAFARTHFGIPIFTGLPFGHCADKLTLPVGGYCTLTVRSGAGRLVVSVRAH